MTTHNKCFSCLVWNGWWCLTTCSCVSTTDEFRPFDLMSFSLWSLQVSQGGNRSYSTVSLKLSLLMSPRQYWSVPERQGSCSSAEVYSGITFRWSMFQRTGARQRADGCVVWPDIGQLSRQANKQWWTGGRHTGVEQPDWQSDGKQQQRIQTGILAQRLRPMCKSPGQQ